MAPSQSFKLDLIRGFIFVILSNYVDFSWCHPKWCFTQFIPDPLLLMCSSLVKYYNVAQVWVVGGYLDGLSRNCCFIFTKSESKSTGFSSGFPVTVGFPNNSQRFWSGERFLSMASICFGLRFFLHQSNMWAFTLVRPSGVRLWVFRFGNFGEQKRLGSWDHIESHSFVKWNQWRMERYW